MSATFELDGQRFIAFNGGPHLKLTPAVSIPLDLAAAAQRPGSREGRSGHEGDAQDAEDRYRGAGAGGRRGPWEMILEAQYIIGATLVGLGATLVIDLWALLLRRGFNIPSLDYCLLGRWLLHMQGGRIVHDSIAAAAQKRHECPLGWVAHYLIGTGFALVFVSLASGTWLKRPTLLPALGFGIVTTLVPFLIMQPSFGLGIAASKTPNPNQVRLKSLMTHTVFGVGLYIWASLLSHLRFHA